MTFINFEKLLQKYFENADQFTVVPRIVFLDANVQTLNDLLMPDRPSKMNVFVKTDSFFIRHRLFYSVTFQLEDGAKSSGTTMDYCIAMLPFFRKKFFKAN